MNVRDIIYFSPSIRIEDLDFDNREHIIDAFAERISSYYIRPAEILNNSRCAFATGIILMSTIDAINNYKNNIAHRIEQFIIDTEEFQYYGDKDQNSIRSEFRDSLRNGVVHEGRVKNGGQFSYEIPFNFVYQEGFLVINPDRLYNRVNIYFEQFINDLRNDNQIYQIFIDKLRHQFEQNINNLRGFRIR